MDEAQIGAGDGQTLSPAEVKAIYRDAYGAASVQPNDEAVSPLWLSVRREIEASFAPGSLSESVLDTLHNVFCCVALNFSKHVFEAVPLPTDRTDKVILGLRISGATKGFLTRCAKELTALERHGSTPDEVCVGTDTVSESGVGRLPLEVSGLPVKLDQAQICSLIDAINEEVRDGALLASQ